MPTPCDESLNIQRQLVFARHHFNDKPVYGDLAGRLEVHWARDIWDRAYFATDPVEQALGWGRHFDGKRVNLVWAFPDGIAW
jgi:hypothetical protein